MIVGFTGSRRGMTGTQSAKVMHMLMDSKATEAHHGDCMGADEQFHDLCMMLDIPVVIHPPQDDSYRACCSGALRVEEEKPFLVRNKLIVAACDFMIATPAEMVEPQPRRGQGTWSTIRWARKSLCPMEIVWPS